MAISERGVEPDGGSRGESPSGPVARQSAAGRWGRRGVAIAVLLAAVAAFVVIVVARDRNVQNEVDRPLRFATVQRTDLNAVRSFDGEVVANDEGPDIVGRAPGTVTRIAPEGSEVARGEPLYSVDGRPVVVMYGAIPAWRDIGPGTTGSDVRQLEENLDALGYEPGTVDERFTSTTRTAVDEWLRSLDLPQDGVVPLGRVVFVRSAVTVSKHLVTPGASVRDGQEVVSSVSSERVVAVPIARRGDLRSGDEVFIALSGRRIPATVLSVSSPGAAGDGNEGTAIVVPDEADALAARAVGSDADVEAVEEVRRDVLAVPVTALLARRQGGYAVEVDQGDGATRLVTVAPGIFTDDLIEVREGLREGDRVVVP